MLKNITFKVTQDLGGLRIDLACQKSGQGVSRRRAKAVIDAGGAFLNKKRVKLASTPVKAHDTIELFYQEGPAAKTYGLTAADLIYLSPRQDFVAVFKPAGLLSQPGLDQDRQHLVPLLKPLLDAKGLKSGNLNLCHRLDKETSGLVLVAQSETVKEELSALFKAKKINKLYHALCHGIPKEKDFEVNAALREPDKKSLKAKVVSFGGKESFTRFKVLESFPAADMSLIACYPKTGRTHQIRAHLEFLGLKILGDKKYGAERLRPRDSQVVEYCLDQHFLLAKALKFSRANHNHEITAPYPESWAETLGLLRKGQTI